jgi:hypothetical protein
MSTHTHRICRTTRLGLIAILALVGVLVTAGSAFGYWIASTNGDVPVMADILPQGATPSSPSPNAPNVTVSFAQASTTNGTPITEYTVKRYAVGSSIPSESFSCSGASSTVTCSDSNVPAGQWQYTDTPLYATNWVGIESAKSPIIDVGTANPSVTITYPVNGVTYGTDWEGAITGTAASDGNTIASVDVAIENTTTGLWWDGSSFDQPSQTFVPVTSGTTSWSLTFAAGGLTSGDNYAVVAQATDSLNDIGTSSTVTFTYNTLPAQTPEVATPLLLPVLALFLMLLAYAFTQRRKRREPGASGPEDSRLPVEPS